MNALLGAPRVPIMWSTPAGADVMERIAAPMIGGLITSFLLELLVYPAFCTVFSWDGGAASPPRHLQALEGEGIKWGILLN